MITTLLSPKKFSQLVASTSAAPRLMRVGCVSYLNAKPLIYGLEDSSDLHLDLDVPSRLLDGLAEGRFDVALLPIIDFQRMEGLRLLPVGGIGCDGSTLTVRIFSRRPIDRIKTLACDPDSHTSVALARILLDQRYGIQPDFVDLTHEADAEARLLIGDKVVCEEPPGFPHQLDLGWAWKQLTGLPFVFAVWTTRADTDLGDLPRRLQAAKDRGLENIRDIIQRHAIVRGWTPGLAFQYLTCYLRFNIAEPQFQAINRFHRLAAEYNLVPTPLRPLDIYR